VFAVSKKRKVKPYSEESGQDKPDWAADLFRGEKKPKKAAKPLESTEVLLGDRLGKGVVDKLSALKAQMSNLPPSSAQQQTTQKKAPVLQKAAKARPEDNGDASFAELFDPQESDDDSSFAELLRDSKLDWRSHKE
jgi:hypothetical protein